MAGQDSHDNIKEKVQAVREVVPGKSNNEIVLVLQYYDYNVEKAIQAYFEDGAKEALGEWHVPTVKPNKKKKNKKKPSGAGEADSAGVSVPVAGAALVSPVSSAQSEQKTQAASNGLSSSSSSNNGSSSKSALTNGDLLYDSESRLEVSDPSLLGAAASGVPQAEVISKEPDPLVNGRSSANPRVPNRPRSHAGSHNHGHGHHSHSGTQRARTASERSTASSVGAGGDNHSKRPFQGLEKSIKDLQRQTVSLERLSLVLDHETERSYKSIKTVFDEMRAHLNTREKQLMAEMNLVKQQAYDVFKMRQEKAAMLKVQIERAEKLSESELAELRADVKHFVADRKVDEEIGKTTRFQYDSDHLKEEILTFGAVMPVKCAYSVRRPSVSSVASSGMGNEETSLVNPPVTMHPAPIQDGYQMTTDEIATLQLRLKNSLKIQGFSPDRQGNPSPVSSGTTSSATQEEEANKTKSARRRNRDRERQEQGKREEDSTASSPVSSSTSAVDARASTHQPFGQQNMPNNLHSNPLPQRSQLSAGRGAGGRGRGGRRGSGMTGYRGQSRGSPRRPYSGSGAGGGGRGGGEPERRSSPRPVLVNGSVN